MGSSCPEKLIPPAPHSLFPPALLISAIVYFSASSSTVEWWETGTHTYMKAILASEQALLPRSPILLQASPAEGISCSYHHHRQAFLALHTLQLTALETWGAGRENKNTLHTPLRLRKEVLLLTPTWCRGEVMWAAEHKQTSLCLNQTSNVKKRQGPWRIPVC